MMFKQFMTCMSEKIDVMERKRIYNKIGAHYKEHVNYKPCLGHNSQVWCYKQYKI